MSGLTVDYAPRKGYLYAMVRGEYRLADAIGAYRQVLQSAARERIARILMDCTSMSGTPTMDERRDFALFMAEEQAKYSGFADGLQIAILVNAQAMDPGRYTQTVANNRGVRMRASESRQELLSWLGV
ncbi:MAG TPA: hypothetical protein VM183_03680 [Burkholderiales bacterium]|nr:hypothetical protein [Burkholderiales bacterium]